MATPAKQENAKVYKTGNSTLCVKTRTLTVDMPFASKLQLLRSVVLTRAGLRDRNCNFQRFYNECALCFCGRPDI